MIARHRRGLALNPKPRALIPVLLLLCLPAAYLFFWPARGGADPRLARVERRTFSRLLRRPGTLQPASRLAIFPKVNGRLLRLVADGTRVAEGAELYQIDPTDFEEQLARQKANLRGVAASWERERQNAIKELRRAQDDLKTRTLRVDLETLRLKELTQGPLPADEVNARTNLENARNLEAASCEEYEVLKSLAADGYVSQAEVRQKALDLAEQSLRVAEADIACRKLLQPDPVKVAEQQLKVREEEKHRNAARERVALLEHNLARATERFQARWRREEERRAELEGHIVKARALAPAPGVVLYSSSRRFGRLGPGREVWEGSEMMTLSDLRTVKAVCTVDENRIAWVHPGQQARVRSIAGGGAPYKGVVRRVAEKGRDEFEDLERETQDLVGKANRQVFDVEVELLDLGMDWRPGQRVEVELLLQELPAVLVVPRGAVFRAGQGESWVFCAGVQANGAPQRRPVKVLGESEVESAIEGLSEGDLVWRVRP